MRECRLRGGRSAVPAARHAGACAEPAAGSSARDRSRRVARSVRVRATVPVERITLFESTLAPSGARYRRVHAATLGRTLTDGLHRANRMSGHAGVPRHRRLVHARPLAAASSPATTGGRPARRRRGSRSRPTAGGARQAEASTISPNARGPVFTNLTASEVASYVFQTVGAHASRAADSAEAAVIGDALYVRAVVPDEGHRRHPACSVRSPACSTIASALQLGGTFRVIRPGLSEFQVREIKLRDFKVPTRRHSAADAADLARQPARGRVRRTRSP